MRSIPAREIKRCGIGAVDPHVQSGPVYVIKNDEPRYVVMDLGHYAELVDALDEISVIRAREALAQARDGEAFVGDAEDTLRRLGLAE